jgi:hypothetical protein
MPPDDRQELVGNIRVRSGAYGVTLIGRLGYGTVMPIQMAALLFWVQWCLAGMCVFSLKQWDPAAFGLALVLGLYFLAANLLNRTRVHATPSGIRVRTGPVPLPNFGHRAIGNAEIADVYVTPFATTNRYSPTYFVSYEIHAFTKDGESVPLLRRIHDRDAADRLAALIRATIGAVSGDRPAVRGGARSVSDNPSEFRGGTKTAVFVFAGFAVVAMMPFIGPHLRTIRLEKATAVILRVHDYIPFTCDVMFDTVDGKSIAEIENCPKSSQPNGNLTIYYDPKHPSRAVVHEFWLWPISLIFGLFSFGGLLVLFLTRARQRYVDGNPILARDTFRFLDRYWGFDKGSAAADKGVLAVHPRDGLALYRPLHRSAFGFVSIDVRVRSRDGGTRDDGAGILFWARDQRSGYVFMAHPVNGTGEVWKIEDNHLSVFSTAFNVPSIHREPGEWNILCVRLDKAGAALIVNGTEVGHVTIEAPLAGGMAGLYAGRPKGTQTFWEFSDFRVYANSAAD